MSENFNGPLKRIKKLNIYKYDIPMGIHINETCNSFDIQYGNNEIFSFEISKKQYSLNEIVTKINNALKKNLDETITFEIVGKKTKISGNENFRLDNIENSILKTFGYTKSNYSDNNSYISEKDHAFDINKIYLYITNIFDNHPIASFDNSGKITQHITAFDKPIQNLSNLDIQFKNSETDDDDIHYFAGSPHSLDIQFEIY